MRTPPGATGVPGHKAPVECGAPTRVAAPFEWKVGHVAAPFAGRLGLSPLEVRTGLVTERLRMGNPPTSLTKLTNRNLDRVYGLVGRDAL